MCRLCELLVRKAHQTECCGRIFCEYCLEQYKKTVMVYKCPNCRTTLNGRHFRDTRTDRAVQLTVVYCTNKADGCDWQGELGQLDNHITSNCMQEQVNCKGCDLQMKRKYLDNHLNNHCPQRFFSCPHCKKRGSFVDITTVHLQQCHQAPLPCPAQDCNRKIKRCEMNNHLEVCLKLIVQCPNQAQGCVAQCKREHLNQHCQVCPKRQHTCPYCGLRGIHEFIMTQHTEECQEIPVPCKNRSCKEKFRRREIENHQEICPKKIIQCPFSTIGCTAEIKIEELEKHEEKVVKHHLRLALFRIQMLERKSLSKVVKLQKYSEFKQTKAIWLSEGIYSSSGGYKMGLNVHSSCSHFDEQTHLSVFVYLTPGENDDTIEWPFQGEVTVELLNQISDSNHKIMKKVFNEKTMDQVKNRKYDLDDTTGYGSKTFMTFEELENPVHLGTQYLVNDTLYFRVTIKPVSQTKPWLACEQ